MLPQSNCVNSGSIVQSAELEKLDVLQSHLIACAEEFGLDQRRTGMLSMAIEEIFVNICHYAYPDSPGQVVLNCRGEREGKDFVVEIIDQGRPFDVSEISEPDLSADIETRRIGGLGWFLVRKIADVLDCFRDNGSNIVRLTLHR